MAINFFDTSALGKHYHAEVGTPKVDALLATPGDIHVISRLAAVELHSVFAKKVRTGQLTPADFQKLVRRFRGDVAGRRLQVVRLLVAHFRAAEELLRRIGPTQNLRTLDAIQLATALQLARTVPPVQFVSADHALGAVAAAEGLTVINPELP